MGSSARGGERGLRLELLHDELERADERLEISELAVVDLDLILALDGRDDFDAHHRVDPEILEGGVVGDRIDLRNLRDERSQIFLQLRVHDLSLQIQVRDRPGPQLGKRFSTTSSRSLRVSIPDKLSSGI